MTKLGTQPMGTRLDRWPQYSIRLEDPPEITGLRETFVSIAPIEAGQLRQLHELLRVRDMITRATYSPKMDVRTDRHG